MTYVKMKACADMTLATAIEDLAENDNISIEEARNRVIESKTYRCLYDFETGMWMEGADYFRDTLNKWG